MTPSISTAKRRGRPSKQGIEKAVPLTKSPFSVSSTKQASMKQFYKCKNEDTFPLRRSSKDSSTSTSGINQISHPIKCESSSLYSSVNQNKENTINLHQNKENIINLHQKPQTPTFDELLNSSHNMSAVHNLKSDVLLSSPSHFVQKGKLMICPSPSSSPVFPLHISKGKGTPTGAIVIYPPPFAVNDRCCVRYDINRGFFGTDEGCFWYGGTVMTVKALKHTKGTAFEWELQVRYDDNQISTVVWPKDYEILGKLHVKGHMNGFDNVDCHVYDRVIYDKGDDIGRAFFCDCRPNDVQLGDRVKAFYQNGMNHYAWHTGRIAAIRNSRTNTDVYVDVAYDDGEYEMYIPLSSSLPVTNDEPDFSGKGRLRKRYNIVAFERGTDKVDWIKGLKIELNSDKWKNIKIGEIIRITSIERKVEVKYVNGRANNLEAKPYEVVVGKLFEAAVSQLKEQDMKCKNEKDKKIKIWPGSEKVAEMMANDDGGLIGRRRSPRGTCVGFPGVGDEFKVTDAFTSENAKKVGEEMKLFAVTSQSTPLSLADDTCVSNTPDSISSSIVLLERNDQSMPRVVSNLVPTVKSAEYNPKSLQDMCRSRKTKRTAMKSVAAAFLTKRKSPVAASEQATSPIKRTRRALPVNTTDSIQIRPNESQGTRRTGRRIKLEVQTQQFDSTQLKKQSPRRATEQLATSASPICIDIDEAADETDSCNPSIQFTNKRPFYKINSSLGCVLTQAVNSSETQIGMQFLTMLNTCHNLIPNYEVNRKLLSLIMYGPQCGKTFYPDCHKMEETLHQLQFHMSALPTSKATNDELIAILGKESASTFLTQMQASYYMVDGDEARTTSQALNRVGQSVHAKVCFATIYCTLLRSIIQPFLSKGATSYRISEPFGYGNEKNSFSDSKLIRSIMQFPSRGSQGVLDTVVTIAATFWFDFRHYLVPNENKDVAVRNDSDNNEAASFLISQSNSFSALMGEITSYMARIYANAANESVDSLADLIKNITFRVWDELEEKVKLAMDSSERDPKSTAAKSKPRGRNATSNLKVMFNSHRDTLQLKFLLQINDNVCPGLQRKLAERFQLVHVYDKLKGVLV